MDEIDQLELERRSLEQQRSEVEFLHREIEKKIEELEEQAEIVERIADGISYVQGLVLRQGSRVLLGTTIAFISGVVVGAWGTHWHVALAGLGVLLVEVFFRWRSRA